MKTLLFLALFGFTAVASDCRFELRRSSFWRSMSIPEKRFILSRERIAETQPLQLVENVRGVPQTIFIYAFRARNPSTLHRKLPKRFRPALYKIVRAVREIHDVYSPEEGFQPNALARVPMVTSVRDGIRFRAFTSSRGEILGFRINWQVEKLHIDLLFDENARLLPDSQNRVSAWTIARVGPRFPRLQTLVCSV